MRERLRRVLPASLYRPVLRRWRRWRQRGVVTTGLSGVAPVSDIWGLDRGTPIDHYFIERFLRSHAHDIVGRVLEMADPRYTRKFGARVERSDVLHYVEGNPQATIVGDLVTGRGVPEDAFDCIILMNTLLLIYDVRAAIATCYRALRPGGVLLAHFTGIASGVPRSDAWEGDYWRFRAASARRLLEERFPPGAVTIEWHGNVRIAAAFLYGLAVEDLTEDEIERRDARYETVILARAVRPAGAGRTP
jgi:SAM-dependent methyltransferase